MGVWDEIKEILHSIGEMIKLQSMKRIGPYTITVSTDSQRILQQGYEHLGKAQSLYVVLTDLGTMTGAEHVLVGLKGAEVQKLYGEGDMWFDECSFMRSVEWGDLWIKTSGHTATVTVSGLAYPSQLMNSLAGWMQ